MKAFGFADEQATRAAVIEIPVPEPRPGEVRVRVHASSVNGYDASVASGMVRGFMEHRYPVVVGKDFSGVVHAVGEDVDALSVGDEVVGLTPPSQTVDAVGTYAEFVVVPATGYIAAKPAGLDHEHAASVGLAAMTIPRGRRRLHHGPQDGADRRGDGRRRDLRRPARRCP